MEYYLGVDLGGTNIVAGLVDREANIIAKDSVRTNMPRSADEICDDIADLCRKILAENGLTFDDVPWLGIGSPGLISDNIIIFANNLDFRNLPLGQVLEEKTGKRTLLQNDANAAAYGEFIAGAGKGHSSLVEITLGTGIGSGIIIDKKIFSGFSGAGAELGHMIINLGGRRCTCGRDGCFEAYCSATGLRAYTQEIMDKHPESAMHSFCNPDGKASAKTAFAAAREGDSAAQEVVDWYLDYLAIGVSNVVNLFQPEVICIGGGVAREGDNILVPLRERVWEKSALEGALRPKILASMVGDDAGLVGAALQGLQGM